jgi:mono/diheme cytochrome c family protein
MNARRTLAPLVALFALACDAIPEDPMAVQVRYRGHYSGPCNAWVKSAVNGREYCASPKLAFSTDQAYADAKPKVDDAAFVGFADKSPEEKKALLVAEGKGVYANNCAACHQAGGEGQGEMYPPLVNNAVVNNADPAEQIATILRGLSGKAINGVAYTGVMTPFGHLSDNQIAAVATYERNSWGHDAGLVEPAAVKAARGN